MVGLVVAWQDLFRGTLSIERAEALRAEAARARDASAVVEATALGALAHLRADEVARGLVLARRAALMARSEASPRLETLAGVVLARLRRHAGRPHLGVQALVGIAAAAPPRWRPWIAWELLLAQGTWTPWLDDGSVAEGGAAADAPVALRDLLAAAREGAGPTFAAAAGRLFASAAGAAPLADDAAATVSALDATRPPAVAIEAWARGDTAELPSALNGLATADPTREPGAPSRALVVARPGAPGRRIQPLGLALFARAHPGAARAEAAGREGQERTLAGLAALALAGPAGAALPEFFRKVYGFAYAPERHGGALRVLLHRMRRAAESIGELIHEGDGLALRLEKPIIVADPRCAERPEAAMVLYLAFTGGASTEAIAERMELPLRTARALVQRLVADGVCRAVREGRHVKYEVDDSIVSRVAPLPPPPAR